MHDACMNGIACMLICLHACNNGVWVFNAIHAYVTVMNYEVDFTISQVCTTPATGTGAGLKFIICERCESFDGSTRYMKQGRGN